MRRQYHFRPTDEGVLIWDVLRLVELAQDLPTTTVPLSEIREIDEPYWFDATGDEPTCRIIADHMKLVTETDLAYPIILCAEGRVMDGMHRVVKALMLGHKTISAKQFTVTPQHDFIDIPADQLSYD